MFFEARGDTAEVFDPVEEPFDAIAFLIKRFGEAVTMLAVYLVGNVRRRALGIDPLPDPIGVVSLVAKQDTATVQVAQQHRRAVDVMGLAGGERQLDRQPPGIGEGVNLGGQSSSAAAHTMNRGVFFTLAAC